MLPQVIMWEIWALQGPFEGMPDGALIHQVGHGLLKLPIEAEEWLPEAQPAEPVEGWVALMRRCLVKEPQHRITAVQLVVELEKLRDKAQEEEQQQAAGGQGEYVTD